MKNASLSALLYREWAMSDKSIRMSLKTLIPGCVLFALIALSLKLGNLATLSPEISELLLGKGSFILKALPAFLLVSFIMIPMDTAVADTNQKWEWFRRSTPISSYRFALTKSLFFALIILSTTILAIASTAVVCAFLDTTITKTDVAITLMLQLVFTITSAIMQVAATYFRSMDKAGILLIVIVLPCVFIPSIILGKMSNTVGAERNLFYEFTEFLTKVLPAFPIIFCLIIVLHFVLFARLYERREK